VIFQKYQKLVNFLWRYIHLIIPQFSGIADERAINASLLKANFDTEIAIGTDVLVGIGKSVLRNRRRMQDRTVTYSTSSLDREMKFDRKLNK
jgi:hypothetical protein